jgi:hypothetical protein
VQASPSFLASAWWSLHDARRLHASSFNKNLNKSGNATSIDLRHVMLHAKGWGSSIQVGDLILQDHPHIPLFSLQAIALRPLFFSA